MTVKISKIVSHTFTEVYNSAFQASKKNCKTETESIWVGGNLVQKRKKKIALLLLGRVSEYNNSLSHSLFFFFSYIFVL